MEKLKINWLVKKNNDWIMASLVKEDGTEITEVSINRTNKKGEVFPNFDGIAPGHEVTGSLWQSSGGKWYLFPPKEEKPRTGASGAFKSQQIEKFQDKKTETINKTLDRKEESIKLSAAQRDSVLMVTTLLDKNYYEGFDKQDLKDLIIEWRNWFLNDKDFNNPPPF